MSDEQNWKIYKDEENKFRELRLACEARILEQHPNERKVGNLRITYKDAEKWDQEALRKLRGDMPFWPFRAEFKPVTNDLKVMSEHYPEAYRKLQDALTITPAKPAFVWKED